MGRNASDGRSSDRGRSGRWRAGSWFLLLVLAGLGGASTGIARAGDLPAGGGVVEAASVAVTGQCNASPLVVNQARTTWNVTDGYWLSEVYLSSINNSCRNKPYSLTIAESAAGFTSLAQWSGTTPGGTTGTVSPAAPVDGYPVNSLPTHNSVRTFIVVRTS